MKLGDIVRLEGVIGRMKEYPMTMSEARAFTRNTEAFEKEIKDFHDARNKGVQKYIKKGQTSIKQSDPAYGKFISELETILQEEVSFEFEPFDEEKFSGLQISPVELASADAIGFFTHKEE